MRRLLVVLIFVVGGYGPAGASGGAYASEEEGPLQDVLRERIEALRYAPQGHVQRDVTTLRAVEHLAAFYEMRSFAPVWVTPTHQRMTTYALRAALRQAEDEGLRMADYHLDAMNETLQALRTAGPDERRTLLIDLELICSDAFLQYAGHLLGGRLDPQQLIPSWNIEARATDLLDSFQALSNGQAVHEALQSLRPQHAEYDALRAALARYRRIADAGGWPSIAEGPTLDRGMEDERVAQLRARLAVTDGVASVPDSLQPVFDAPLDEAVRAFQQRHGLTADGRVGPATRAALNVPVETRINQLVVNLERWRWLPNDLGRRYVLVNIASFDLQVVEEGETVLEMPVVVGRSYRQTPVFSDEISYLVLSPYWHVPHSIATRDKLPEFQRDPSAAARQGFQIFQGWSTQAQPIDPMTIDWDALSARNFPYRLRQNPGPNNALGTVKFMFPNPYSVYLHDTPARQLFGRDTRDFSSGCIRVARPLDLAEYLLRDNSGWDRATIERNMGRSDERTVVLNERVPVHLLYWTAWAQSDGTVHFRDDVYNRDIDVQMALAGRVTVPPALHALLDSGNTPSVRTTP
ncbi:MAG: L,D-transpeptidase family protein [Longimonas sp.]|uniref:L,D-transpeptidase family protein n=1 Tax=Longimonas sp. TaxID=2039626 RepID=UPI00334D051D